MTGTLNTSKVSRMFGRSSKSRDRDKARIRNLENQVEELQRELEIERSDRAHDREMFDFEKATLERIIRYHADANDALNWINRATTAEAKLEAMRLAGGTGDAGGRDVGG